MMPNACYIRQADRLSFGQILDRHLGFSSNELENHACAEKSDLDPQAGEEKLLDCLEDYFSLPARTLNRALFSHGCGKESKDIASSF